MRQAASEVIARKGATNHAIGLVTASLLRWCLRGERRVLTVSRIATVRASVLLGDDTLAATGEITRTQIVD